MTPHLDPKRLALLPLGTGNAFTTLRYHTSMLVMAEGYVLAIDAPTPFGKVLREATSKAGLNLALSDLDAVFLTHLHGDHCSGLEELGFYRKYLTQREKPTILLLDELRRPLWENRLSAAMGRAAVGLADYYDVVGLSENQVVRQGPLQIAVCPSSHTLPCLALKISYNGRSVGISADTAFDPRLIDFLATADTIIHECGPGQGHTDAEHLRKLPKSVREKLWVTHLSDDFDAAKTGLRPLIEGEVVYA